MAKIAAQADAPGYFMKLKVQQGVFYVKSKYGWPMQVRLGPVFDSLIPSMEDGKWYGLQELITAELEHESGAV